MPRGTARALAPPIGEVCQRLARRRVSGSRNRIAVVEDCARSHRADRTKAASANRQVSSFKQRFYAHESALIEDGVTIGDDSRIWHDVHVRRGARIGARCILGKGVYVD